MDIVQLMTNKFSILTPREGARQVRKDLSLSANTMQFVYCAKYNRKLDKLYD